MFTCITVHVMNAYLLHVFICEDDTNGPKESVPPPLTVTYPQIYTIVCPKIISYANTSYFFLFDLYMFRA